MYCILAAIRHKAGWLQEAGDMMRTETPRSLPYPLEHAAQLSCCKAHSKAEPLGLKYVLYSHKAEGRLPQQNALHLHLSLKPSWPGNVQQSHVNSSDNFPSGQKKKSIQTALQPLSASFPHRAKWGYFTEMSVCKYKFQNCTVMSQGNKMFTGLLLQHMRWELPGPAFWCFGVSWSMSQGAEERAVWRW